MKLKKIISFVLIIGLMFFINGCGKKEDNNDKSDSLNSEEKKSDINVVNPNSKSRSYAVMINNHNVARPNQSGLQDAYIMYEMVVEGGITRMLAIFKDKLPDRVGTVRSARHYYLDYAMENDAIYVHWGESPQAGTDMDKYSITHFDGIAGSSAFWKDTSIKVATEHRGYVNLVKIDEQAKNKDYRLTTNKDLLLKYSASKIDYDTEEKALKIEIKYSNYMTVKYEYDETTKTYLRFANGSKHVDYVTKKQYNFKNIIAYQVKNISIDDYGRQNLENVGSGTGYYFTDGEMIKINWKKSSRESQTVYTYENGENLVVNDGNTFIQIIPTSGQINFS